MQVIPHALAGIVLEPRDWLRAQDHAHLQVGDRLALVRESDNTYDPNAVRVEWHGEKLGYVPHAGNATVAKLLDKGIKVSGRIINLHPGRSQWQRILFEVVIDE